jgi:hypothetical protein
MTGDRDPARLGDYRAARIGAAGALTAVLVVLLLIDALSPSYDINAVVLIPLLGTIAGLLGIEGLSVLRGGK